MSSCYLLLLVFVTDAASRNTEIRLIQEANVALIPPPVFTIPAALLRHPVPVAIVSALCFG